MTEPLFDIEHLYDKIATDSCPVIGLTSSSPQVRGVLLALASTVSNTVIPRRGYLPPRAVVMDDAGEHAIRAARSSGEPIIVIGSPESLERWQGVFPITAVTD